MNMSIKKYSLILSLVVYLLPSFSSATTLDSLAVGQIFTLGKPTVNDTDRKVMRYKYLFETRSLPSNLDINDIENRNGYLWEGQAPNSMHDWLNEYPTKTFYVDSVFSAQGIQYALCYWVDERGMAYNEDAVDNKHYKNLYVLKNPSKAILVGEVVPSTKSYVEPMLIEEPVRALTLFIKRTPINSFAIGVLAFALLIFLFNRYSVNRNLDYEIKEGLTTNITVDKLWQVQENKYWLKILFEKHPKHALKLRNWENDVEQLQALNPAHCKQYGLSDKETISLLDGAIKKVKEVRLKMSSSSKGLGEWENDVVALLDNSRKIYMKHGMATQEVNKLMGEFGKFEADLLIERDKANEEMIRLISSHIKA
jgi:hypothetical protein